MTNYFVRLFSSEGCTIEECFSTLLPLVSDSENEFLLRPIHEKEIHDAVFDMHPDKSLGPDGMNPTFYQAFWDIVGKDIRIACISFISSFSLRKGINDTHLVLIPKKQNVETMDDLRTISLCNVIYKIVSKTLANHLKNILPNVVCQSQSAFVPGRSIIDNILISTAVLHYLNRKTQGKDGYAALKIDMAKAYDRVE